MWQKAMIFVIGSSILMTIVVLLFSAKELMPVSISPVPVPVSAEESRRLAAEYIISRPEFRHSGGGNLQMVRAAAGSQGCNSCYTFFFRFDSSAGQVEYTVRMSGGNVADFGPASP